MKWIITTSAFNLANHDQRFGFEGTEEELKAVIKERKDRLAERNDPFLQKEYSYQPLDEWFNKLQKAT